MCTPRCLLHVEPCELAPLPTNTFEEFLQVLGVKPERQRNSGSIFRRDVLRAGEEAAQDGPPLDGLLAMASRKGKHEPTNPPCPRSPLHSPMPRTRRLNAWVALHECGRQYETTGNTCDGRVLLERGE